MEESAVSASVQCVCSSVCVAVCTRHGAASSGFCVSALTGQRSGSYRPAVGVNIVPVRVYDLKAGFAFAVFVFSVFDILAARRALFEEVRDVSHL